MTAVGGPDESDDPDGAKAYRGVNVGLTAAAAGLGILTAYMFDRASSASTVAAVASRAASLKNDQSASETCNNAIANWNDQRGTSLGAVRDQLDLDRDTEKTKADAEKAKREAVAAKAEAENAKAAAEARLKCMTPELLSSQTVKDCQSKCTNGANVCREGCVSQAVDECARPAAK